MKDQECQNIERIIVRNGHNLALHWTAHSRRSFAAGERRR